jgi:hypothetical protein
MRRGSGYPRHLLPWWGRAVAVVACGEAVWAVRGYVPPLTPAPIAHDAVLPYCLPCRKHVLHLDGITYSGRLSRIMHINSAILKVGGWAGLVRA